MKPGQFHKHRVCLGILFGVVFASVWPAGATVTTNIFSTQFEATEGYSTTTNLVGQNGWLGFGSGGNGLVPDSFTNQAHAHSTADYEDDVENEPITQSPNHPITQSPPPVLPAGEC